MDVFCVPPDRVDDYWQAVSGLIKPALEGTLTDYNFVSTDVLAGRNLLWLVWDGTEVYAACVTSLGIANGKKFCTIVACGGRQMLLWRHLIDRIEKFARDEGCKSLAIMGRRGWSKIYPDFALTSTTIEKELT